MKRALVFAGFSHQSYVHEARALFPTDTTELICIHRRPPTTPSKHKYLKLFDTTYHFDDLTASVIADLSSRLLLVVATQERDMKTYIDTLQLLGSISSEEADLYGAATNKRRFKEVLRASNPELVPALYVYERESGFNEPLSFPVVLKPTGLAGSSFVYVARTQQEVDRYLKKNLDDILQEVREFYDRSSTLIAEEFLEGPQYSVNAYIDERGAQTLCPILRVVPAFELGIQDTYNAIQFSEELPEEDKNSLTDALKKVVTAFKLRSTTAHFDCVKTASGWKLFEIGLRMGGKRQEIYKLSNGFNHFANDLKNRAGQSVTVPPLRRYVGVVTRAAEREGTLEEVSYSRSVTAPNAPLVHEDKLAKLGEEVKPVCLGGGTLIRLFVLGKDGARVTETSRHLFESVNFTITQ